MRRTQQNADRQRRRGVRSRLVACVATVAMLVTSVAAGTAVAVELGGGDTADQTTQNTATLEQQGAGDDTTSMPSDGTDGDHGVVESDGATEGDGDTAGKGNTADEVSDAGDAEKQKASVPAPQAVESYAYDHKDVPSIIENVEPTSDKIHVNLFDYSQGNATDGGVNYGTQRQWVDGYFDWKNFQWVDGHYEYPQRTFLFGESGGVNNINDWTKENGGVRQGIVADELTDSGYPRLADENGGDDLGYLFDPDGDTTGVELKGADADGLFRKDKDDYYYFDSADNFARLDEEGNRFDLYENGRFDNFSEVTGAVGHGAFLPFNDLKENGDNYVSSGNTFDGLHGYRLEGDNATGDSTNKNIVDYYFGMTVAADFYMPDGRQVDGEDMVFEFEGDDDVWVFVDGKLVLDLGGIHDNYGGSINFTDGTVTVNDDNHAGTQESLQQIFGSLDSLENKTHELKVFYLERGAGGSNCKFRFNLPAVPTSGEDLSVAKAVSGDVDQNAAYTMNVLLNGTDLYQSTYQVYTLSGQEVGDEQTAVNGAITLKAGQYATLTDSNITKDTRYVVKEVVDSANGFQVTATGNGTGDITMTDQADGSVQSGMLTVAEDSFVTIVNTKPLGQPDRSKRIGRNEDGTYTLALDVIGQNSEDTQVTTTPLDISLVLDVSGSMADYMEYEKVYKVNPNGTYYIKDGDTYRKLTHYRNNYWTYNNEFYTPKSSSTSQGAQFYKGTGKTKLQALQDAVKSFAEATEQENQSIQDPNSKHQISVIKFSGDTKSTEGNDTYWNDYNEWNNTQVVQSLTSDMDEVTSAVGKLRAVGGTYSQNGLQKASDSLQDARPNAKKVVIFFTDGEPGESGWDRSIAAHAVNQAYSLKNETKATVYSIGVFGGANPKDTDGNFNRFMNAVSSNYPDAQCTRYGSQVNSFDNLELGNKASGDAQYYYAATNADELDAVFEGIQSSITTGASYSNVSIVDELSQYARIDDSVEYENPAGTDGFHEVTGGVTLKVQRPDSDAAGGWADVPEGDAQYPKGYTISYKPSGSSDSMGTVKVEFADEYKLVDGWKYTLEFKVRPTQAAYDEYASSGYPADSSTGSGKTEGDEGTDLYDPGTSAGKPGFRSNKQAYVKYTSGGKEDKAYYAHPVLQVEYTPVTVAADAFVKVRKDLVGRPWTDDSFSFTLTGESSVPMPCVQPGEGNACQVTINSSTGDNHAASFGGVTYATPGTYTYTVVEDGPADDAGSDLDYSLAEYRVTVTVSSDPANPGGLKADVKVMMTKNDAGESLVNPQPQEGGNALVAVFRNVLNTYTYGNDATAKLGLRKVLENKELAANEFLFVLQDVTDYNADGAPEEKIKDSATSQPLLDDGVTASNDEDGGIGFGTVLFTAPGTYTVKVSEAIPGDGDKEPGIVYDEHALYVRYTLAKDEDGVLRMTDRKYYVSKDGIEPASDAKWTTDWDADVPSEDQLASDLTWTNRYVAVSALPLTGGDSTARTLILAGGGVLLVAGVAWLLARRRRA